MTNLTICLAFGPAPVVLGEPDRPTVYAESSRVVDPVSGDVWIGTLGSGLIRESHGRRDVFDQFNSGLPGNLVFSVTVGEGRVFAATNGGTCAYEPYLEEWDLLEARRSDRARSALVELRWTAAGLRGRRWNGGVNWWDAAKREWTPSDQHWTKKRPESAAEAGAGGDLENGSTPFSIAVLGPGTRRIALPGDEAMSRRPLPHPDLPTAQRTIARAAKAIASADVGAFTVAEATPGYANYAWGLIEDDLAAYARREEVLGAVANLDDRASYTEAAATFLQIPLVSISVGPVETAVEAPETRWVFRCRAEEARAFRRVLDWLATVKNKRRWSVVVDEPNTNASPWSATVQDDVHANGRPGFQRIAWSAESIATIADGISTGGVEVVFAWIAADDAVNLIQAIRGAGSAALVVVGPEALEPRFTARLDGKTEGIIALFPPKTGSMVATQSMTAGEISTRTASASEHLLTAILHSPRNRAAVRAALERMETDLALEEHATGTDSRRTEVTIALWVSGGWQFESLPDAAMGKRSGAPTP